MAVIDRLSGEHEFLPESVAEAPQRLDRRRDGAALDPRDRRLTRTRARSKVG